MAKAKVWQEKDIREVLDQISLKMGIPCDYVPIIISKRMTRCKGKCSTKLINRKVKGTKFTFSKLFLDGNYSEDSVKGTIIHEYIHLYTNVVNNSFCGHNDKFKENCLRAGISPDTYFIDEPVNKDYDKNSEKMKKKYIVTCECCGYSFERVRFLGGPQHFANIYRCGRCNGNFKIIDKQSNKVYQYEKE